MSLPSPRIANADVTKRNRRERAETIFLCLSSSPEERFLGEVEIKDGLFLLWVLNIASREIPWSRLSFYILLF
jgi:hypothetical protein